MKHQPQRTCVGCGGKRPPDEMLRIAAQNGEAPQLDAGKQKAAGRGAYLCGATDGALDCARKAWKRRAVERALKLKVPLNAAFKARVEAAIETAISTQINSQESQHMN